MDDCHPQSDSRLLVINPRLSGLFIALAIIVLILLWSNRTSAARFDPTPFILPTSTIDTQTIALMQNQWVDVIVRADESNPFDPFDVNEVVVRMSNSPWTDDGADGRFLLPLCPAGETIYAWAPGYRIESVRCDGQTTKFQIQLTHLKAVDNSNYLWSSAINDCNTCHSNLSYLTPTPPPGFAMQAEPTRPNQPSYDEMNEWFKSGHGKVFGDGYFETMYKGTSATGKLSIPARPVVIDNEWVPVPPEISDLYHGPGFRLDFPSQPGNCAYCHVPATVSASQDGVDLYNLFPTPGGSWGEGVTCDVCHKVFEVILADDGNPFPDQPGIRSFKFLRPDNGVFITGPFSNLITKSRDGRSLTANHHLTCTPLFSRSEFCAPCHFGKFGDMVVYNSYGEWKESLFAKNPADPAYRTCQDCHMSHLDVNDKSSVWTQRQACSASNLDFQDFNHNMMNLGQYTDLETGKTAEIPRMVKGAADLTINFDQRSADINTLDVSVMVENKKAGHKFPTDSPLRHLILVLTAVDRVNTPLIQVDGGRIPNWAGPGPITIDTANITNSMEQIGIEDYAGLPGKIFANLLVEEETNLSPGMAYWNETKAAFVDSTNGNSSDTRLVPGVPDLSAYSFAMPDEGNVRITIDLMYRYAFYDLVVWKEWFNDQRADILVTRVECEGPSADPLRITCVQTEPLAPTATPTPTP
jgi:hypothetical protein